MAFQRAYLDEGTNLIYNLLFCDDLSLFADSAKHSPTLKRLFDGAQDEAALRAIAEDAKIATRYRLLAFHQLRVLGKPVGDPVLLGVIVEAPMDQGRDTLAAYADGSARYINQTGKMTLVDAPVPLFAEKVRDLLAESAKMAGHLKPYRAERLEPPRQGGATRITFLLTDGPRVGERPMNEIMTDSIGEPVIRAAAVLLDAVVELTLGVREGEAAALRKT
ncbi:MAG TPA: hypothetical protein VG841_14535 [Caulobacterales bacterium]|nr:hypothetical protein [Caulobacterales bacterium]